ncbi:hypothetical protein A2U01_0057338, partial [Trifolium medium]|nr:hypothetical protein [Trifolium medium]
LLSPNFWNNSRYITSWWAMVAMTMSGKISFGMPPGYSWSSKPSIALWFCKEDGHVVLTKHISAILLFVVPLDLPFGFDGPPVMEAVFWLSA